MVYISSQNLYLILGGTDYVPSICFFGTTEALRSLELGLARWRSECQPYIFPRDFRDKKQRFNDI